MNLPPGDLARLAFLFRVVDREAHHLRTTTRRVFSKPMTLQRAARLGGDVDDSERVEAFVARFSRLQDTLGDNLLPVCLAALGEPVGAAIDNLDRAERLGLINSADEWLAARRLRNRMVHEYVEDAAVLADSLEQGRDKVETLLAAEAAFRVEGQRRGWIEPESSLP